MSHVFSLLGDSNTKRHMNPTNCRDRPLMSGCQVLECGRLAVLAESLKSVRAETNIVILACISNFVSRSKDSGSTSNRVEPVFQEFASLIGAEATKFAGRYYLVSPPMYRQTPLWYRDGLPEILTKFPISFRDLPRNVLLMSSFSNPVLDPDGVHLSAYSGLEYVLHLFDEAIRVVAALTLPLPEAISVTQEATRALQDRVVVLEKDHERLRKELEDKSAEDSEYADFQTNLREEAYFTVSGLKRLPTGLSPKEWQQKAVQEVQDVLTVLMGKEYPIVFVQNGTSKRKDAPATYHVLMKSTADSQEIRDKFGSFFLGEPGTDLRPESLKGVSLQMKVTPATYGRIVILKVLGRRYVAANKGSKFQVISYKPRPLLKITPAEGSTDRRVLTFNYIEAIRSLPTNLTKEEADDIVKRISPKLHGKLRSIFSIINDDMLTKRPRSASGQGHEGGTSESSGRGESSKSSRGRGGGSNRNPKRGASSPANSSAEKQKK